MNKLIKEFINKLEEQFKKSFCMCPFCSEFPNILREYKLKFKEGAKDGRK